MIEPAQFTDPLRALGYSRYAGVPCSFLKPFINHVIGGSSLDYVGASSEGEAVGIALGNHLAGHGSVAMCQNSGLGNMVNPLTSLTHPFRIPVLLIVTWRGQPGLTDEPQHEQMGRVTGSLLDAIEIPHRPFPSAPEEVASVIDEADRFMRKHQRPFALVMRRGSVAPHPLEEEDPGVAVACASDVRALGDPGNRMIRTRALELVLENLAGDEAIVATTGMTGRELFNLADRENHFYVVGGMGTASAIGFGVAHARPGQPVVVLDGDGAALMKLGNLATIGRYQPRRFLHIVLDNERHASTGGQSTSAATTRFAAAAAACNYRRVVATDDCATLPAIIRDLRSAEGPSLLHLKIRPGNPAGIGRPTVTPVAVKERFMNFLARHG